MISYSKIKSLIIDVDGTLTDGKIYMSARGEAFKAFNIKDGCAIHDLLPMAGIIPIIITGRESQIVINRCLELGIEHLYQNCQDKAAKLREIAGDFGFIPDRQGRYQEIAYIGDDINDLAPMKLASLVMCPADACREVREIADYVSPVMGGYGAVRDAVEYMLNTIQQEQ